MNDSLRGEIQKLVDYASENMGNDVLLAQTTEDILSLFTDAVEREAEAMIKENNKWKDEEGECGLCMEDEHCDHDVKNQALSDIRTRLKQWGGV